MQSQRHQVTIANTGETYECQAGESVLVGMARMGKRGIPLGCRGGGCGVCKVEVVAGDCATSRMSAAHVGDDDRRARRLLACCTYPAGPLVVRVVGGLEKNACRRATAEVMS
ncbi:2Fe-2S iron-sulfur cluster binding domain-containing protein [Derxia gummosa]|uniref:2Fe-2S iron-sulfur cluster binding domain-containing protein n=1 Tax=Derxia gummosa DSM 723 TaxID=1121388 RepID=A0A8B6X3U0_9BURK|nr:2Fe-2S iron-sulfur cluster binding domain-containing protein [Derxia gummosa]